MSTLLVVASFGFSIRESAARTQHKSQTYSTASHSTRKHHAPLSARQHTTHIASSSHKHRGRSIAAGRRGKHHAVIVAHGKPRHAYPVDFFLARPPAFETTSLPTELSAKISHAFDEGTADTYATRTLVRAGVITYHPLRGGVFWRREPVKYIILHSTETGIPLGAVRVIESWSSMGRRHPGAQFVIDRDGTIYQAVDPDLGTVHINIFKTRPGINNDNSIGIEMCHTGSQDYPVALRQSAKHLVAYLQQRYNVTDENVITHRYAQNGDHTDPVNFDLETFLSEKNVFKNAAIANRVKELAQEATAWTPASTSVSTPTTYLQPHMTLPIPETPKHPVDSTIHSIQTTSTSSTSTSSTGTATGVSTPGLRAPMEMDPSQAHLLNSVTPMPDASSAKSNSGSGNSLQMLAPGKN